VTAPATAPAPLRRGRVKLWLPGKAYGFVQPEDGTKDVFFHASALEPAAPIAQGDAVEYELASGTKIPQAARLKRV
jgi:CspA family cold shock protein